MRLRLLAAAACLACGLAFPLRAQAGGDGPEQPCAVVPDTAVVPTAKQVEERRALRASLDSLARAHGVAAPEGLLLVDIDTTRRGKVTFLDTNFPAALVRTATGFVGEYLSSLPEGRAYQALVRVDGDYPALAHGKRNCPPVLANGDLLSELMQRVLERHPEARTHRTAVAKRAVVRLVVNRAGAISHAEVVQPTGDANIDPYLEVIARRLLFLPAKLDDQPYDVRMRFAMTFNVK